MLQSTSDMNVAMLSSIEPSTLVYAKLSFESGRQGLFAKTGSTYQLNNIEADGWAQAPFGMSAPFDPTSTRRQLQILLTEPQVAKFEALDDHNKREIIRLGLVKGKKMDYTPYVKEYEGQKLLNCKVDIGPRSPTRLWKAVRGSGGLMFTKGVIGDINANATYGVILRLGSMWMQAGNKFGANAIIDELLIQPAPEPMAPTFQVPGGISAVPEPEADDMDFDA